MRKRPFIFIFIFVLLLIVPSASAAWWNSSWQYKTDSVVSSPSFPYQMNLTVHSSSGTSNATDVFLNGKNATNFDDIRFVLNDTTPLSYWIEDNTTNPIKVWVNVTTNGTVSMYYGNPSAVSESNGTATFEFFDGAETGILTDKWTQEVGTATSYSTDVAKSGSKSIKVDASSADQKIAASQSGQKIVEMDFYDDNDQTALWNMYIDVVSEIAVGAGLDTNQRTGYYVGLLNNSWTLPDNLTRSVGWHHLKMELTGSTATAWIDGIQQASGFNTNSISQIKIRAVTSGSRFSVSYYDNVLVRASATTEPTWGTWGSEIPLSGAYITSWNNNYTNDQSTTFTLTGNQVVNYSIVGERNTGYAWYVDGIDQSTNNSYFVYQLPNTGTFNITGVAVNTTNGSASISWNVTLNILLISPANNTVDYYNYPPITGVINHTWSSTGYPYYNIQIAEDPSFNLMVVDDYTTDTYYQRGIQEGTYYWRVRDYNQNTSTYGTWTPTYTYTLNANTTSNGTGIEGVVYELISGVQTPVDNARVFIYNSTWSDEVVTGSNGYYLWNNLKAGGIYYVKASKTNYIDSELQTVNTTANVITTKNILLGECTSVWTCSSNKQYVKFTVTNLFDAPYVGVTIDVYPNGNAVAQYSKVTGSDGSATFFLVIDGYYKIVLSGGGLSDTLTYYVYGKDESHTIRIMGGFPTGGDRQNDINATLSWNMINTNYANLSVIYNDTIGSTSVLNFYTKNLTTGETCYQSSSSNVVTLNCTVPASGAYQLGYNATSSKYGFLQQDKIKDFGIGNATNPLVPTHINPTDMHWISIALLVFVASMFSVTSSKYGAVIIPVIALILWSLGWLQVPSELIIIAVVLGIMVYMRESESKIEV